MRTFVTWCAAALVGAFLAALGTLASSPETAVQALADEHQAVSLATTGTAVTDDPGAVCGSDLECASLHPDVNGYGTEGKATLITDYGTVPEALWEALFDMGYRGTPGDGAERFYVDYGTVVDVPGGLYLATVDGWFTCLDNVTVPGIECSGTGPVVPIGHVVAGMHIPASAPSGAPVVERWEDGSAVYADGMSFDPEERVFRLPIT